MSEEYEIYAGGGRDGRVVDVRESYADWAHDEARLPLELEES